jgi:tRNA-uridine 2-sulfurtransferase
MNDRGNRRVLVGMSGGVDSSTAAALLLQQGYEVIGVTLRLWPQSCDALNEDVCCGPQAVTDARAVCHKLGIPHYAINERDTFQRDVIDPFVSEYQAGRTPNPCIWCNDKLKFGSLLRRADALDARYVATGHYARIEALPDGSRWLLKRGLDPKKDQSYFLFSLRQSQLSRALMPLGTLTKSDTRQRARDLSLRTADKQESMEICFVPSHDYGEFLVQTAGVAKNRGQIVDLQGRVLGHHDGIAFFTIGQRKGLGVAFGKPLYVVKLDPALNQVILGEAADLERTTCELEGCNWIAWENPPTQFEGVARIRYKHAGAPALVRPGPGGTAQVEFRQAQRAITPGQACVFYQDDLVVGGGWIRRW